MKRLLTPFTRPATLSSNQLLVMVSIYLILFYNYAFFSHTLESYPLSLVNILLLVSIALLFSTFNVLLLVVVSARYIIRPALMIFLVLSSLAACFMDSYGVIIDDHMIENIVSTNLSEAMDLLNFRVVVYLVFLGILPAYYVYRVNIQYGTFRTELFSRLKLVTIAIAVIASLLLLSGKFYASFFREHKSLRSYANPSYYVYSVGKYIANKLSSGNKQLALVGTDARTPSEDPHRELIIMVLGETARADRFSLNGYKRNTNPLLSNENVISFTNVHSCGTSTAVSVPCIFSVHGMAGSGNEQASENLLDVLHHAGVNILWRDNNSDSKGVALRIPYENFMHADKNPVCDVECRDEGMLIGLQNYINRQDEGDILIVLHQMGNHGPAYYKRYPEEFEKFIPVCHTGELANCSLDEINNTYDNAILYTDYFLSKVIEFLRSNDKMFETAMIYVSDHGESLGEGGLFLHGLPRFMAPDAQTHIPAIFWFGENFDIDMNNIQNKTGLEFTHDNIFHTMLGLFEVETSVYNPGMDIVHSKWDKEIGHLHDH